MKRDSWGAERRTKKSVTAGKDGRTSVAGGGEVSGKENTGREE